MRETRRTRRVVALTGALAAVAMIVAGALALTRGSAFGNVVGVVLVACGIIVLGSSIVLWWSARRLPE